MNLSQAWITTAVTDTDARNALVLVRSLQLSFTSRPAAVIASSNLKGNIRNALHDTFDLVYLLEEGAGPGDEFLLEEDWTATEIVSGVFDRCIRLPPCSIAVKNADALFEDEITDLGCFHDALTLAEYGIVSFPDIFNPQSAKEYWHNILERNAAENFLRIYQNQIEPMLGGNLCSSASLLQPIRIGNTESIAIIGMSCRYPRCNSLEQFWKLLFEGEDGTSRPPSHRWNKDECLPATRDWKHTAAGFLNVPVTNFDARFFGVSPKEAEILDPQHRILMEVSWEALEDACIDPQSLKGTSGSVVIGSWTKDFQEIVKNFGIADDFRTYIGSSLGTASARISQQLKLTGPSLGIENGCSSSMVAVHLACKSLLSGETNLALAGGVNLLLNPFDESLIPSALSSEFRCKTFSENADGFARAEGCGVLVLKRFTDAVKDGDRIWALIRGSGISQEGVSTSLGTPTVECESLAMLRAMEDAKVKPEDISYVEAHGTGTIVGDPLEVAAIAKAYYSSLRKEKLVIGSVKTNVGHTESCSGITGIMKVVLAMHHGVIPLHRNFNKLNPVIDLDAVPAKIPLETLEWSGHPGKSKLAGINSFGMAGTDAHLIIEEPPPAQGRASEFASENENAERPLHVLKVSAKSEASLQNLLTSVQKNVASSGTAALSNICYSGNIGRADFSFRAVLIAKWKGEMIAKIQHNTFPVDEIPLHTGKICFLFAGQATAYPEMAKQLYQTSPVFRRHFSHCENVFSKFHQINVQDVLWVPTATEKMRGSEYAHSAIFCVQYALMKLWNSWGVKADFVLGHSLGECAAAVDAGLLSLKDAIMLVVERGRLTDKLPAGNMLAIRANESYVASALKTFHAEQKNSGILDLAIVNSEDQTVVAGDPHLIQSFSEFCTENGMKWTKLKSSNAVHSRHVDSIMEDIKNICKRLDGKKLPGVNSKYISSMLGQLVKPEIVNEEYWAQQGREKVSFLDASRKAVQLGCTVFIEIGSQPILSALVKQNAGRDVVCVPSLRKGEDNWETLLHSLGALYLNGVVIDWESFDNGYRREKIRVLPHYPFSGRKFWPTRKVLEKEVSSYPLLGASLETATAADIFQSSFSLSSHIYLKDHVIGKSVVFPGAGYLEMCLAAGLQTFGHRTPLQVTNLSFDAPFQLREMNSVELQTVVRRIHELCRTADDGVSVQIYQKMEPDSWLLHAEAFVETLDVTTGEYALPLKIEASIRKIFGEKLESRLTSEFYEKIAKVGLPFGPMFCSLGKSWKSSDSKLPLSIIAEVKAPSLYNRYVVHPIILDAMLQSVLFLNFCTIGAEFKLLLPLKVGKFVWLGRNTTNQAYVVVLRSVLSEGKDSCTIILVDENGNTLAVMTRVEVVTTTTKILEVALEQQNAPKNNMPVMWEENWCPSNGPMHDRLDFDSSNDDEYYSEDILREFSRKYNILDVGASEVIRFLKKFVYFSILRLLYQCEMKTLSIGDNLELDELVLKLKINTKWSKLLGYFLDVPCEEGALAKVSTEGQYQCVGEIPGKIEVNDTLHSAELTTTLQSKFSSAELMYKMGENLCGILNGTISSLSILFPENAEALSVGTFYQEYYDLVGLRSLYVEAMLHWLKHWKRTCKGKFVLRILEIGGGTGSLTQMLFSALKEVGVNFEYTFTDISPTFFSAAKGLFETFQDSVFYRKFNIEKDPIDQGFIPEYYDYICAADVFHATKDIRESLENAKTLLRTGGRLDVIEMTKVNRIVTFLFGAVEGFWRYQDFDLRKDHCTLSKTGWKNAAESVGLEVPAILSCSNDYHSLISFRKGKENIRKLVKLISSDKLWLHFHQEDSKLSNFLLDGLKRCTNRNVLVVRSGSELKIGKNGATVKLSSESDFAALIDLVEKRRMILEGILYCWTLDRSLSTQEAVLRPYFYLAKSIAKINQRNRSKPRLITLFDGVAPIVEGEGMEGYFSSTVWGFVKSLNAENSEMNCRCIDVKMCGEGDMQQVFYEIWRDWEEESQPHLHVAYREGLRFTPKLKHYQPQLTNNDIPLLAYRFQLELPESKLIDDLKFVNMEMGSVNEDEVEVQVKACGLNFRDCLSVLQPPEYSREINGIGLDIAGVVSRVGENVTRWAVGDRVMGLNTSQQLPTHLKWNQGDVFGIEDEITFCEAATFPTVFISAYISLVEIARVKPTDTILIHTASGGVGLCAIQICRYLGVNNLICTAGSKRKQQYLKELGIHHVLNSRNTNYGNSILELTEGRGVDVVLNSLTSDGFKEASLLACGKGGRFVEISKLSIWLPEEVKVVRPDVQYFIVDASKLEPKEWRRLMTILSNFCRRKTISPLPYVRYDAIRIKDALKYLQKAKHIGKIVCVMPDIKQIDGRYVVETPLFHDNCTYLITGGLGGIGFQVCRWMVQKGARYILLGGRNMPSTSLQKSISEMNLKNGVNISAVLLDVGNFVECEELIRNGISGMGYPLLRGIMHCAGVLSDGVIETQNWDNFPLTFRAKVDGTINLHNATKDIKLEHFVLFSSIAAVFGSPAQANHTAGNSFEDCFAHYRISMGLPATSINWGQWIDVGVATEVELPGIKPFGSDQGIAALEYALRQNRTQTCVCNVDSFNAVAKRIPHLASYLDENLWKFNVNSIPLISAQYTKPDVTLPRGAYFWDTFNLQLDGALKLQLIKEQLGLILRSVLKLDWSDIIDENVPFQNMGVDSLMTIEIRNALQLFLGNRANIKTATLRDNGNLQQLSKVILEMIQSK